MSNDMIIKVIVKGKAAASEIKKVEKGVERVGSKTEETERRTADSVKKMTVSWRKLAVGVVAVAAALGKAIQKGKELNDAQSGLTDSQKEWAVKLSETNKLSAEQISMFMSTGKAAGMADEKLKELAKGASALSYAFPDEAAETLSEALMMLMHTGEAQGYAVDILEQQMATLGFKFGDVDLAAVSLADKLILMNMAIATGNKRLAENKYAEVDGAISKMANSFAILGDKSLAFLDSVGAFWLINKAMQVFNVYLAETNRGFAWLNNLVTGTEESQKKLTEAQLASNEAANEFLGLTEYFKEREQAVANVTKRIKESTAATKEGSEALKVENALTKEQIEMKAKLQVLSDANKKLKSDAVALAIKREEERIEREVRADERDRQRLQDDLDRADVWAAYRIDSEEDVENAWMSAQVSMAEGMAEMVVSGKASFKDLAQSIIKELIMIQARMMAVKLISGIGSLFGGGNATPAVTKHTGGVISHHAGFIPSYHSGLRTDERLAKLQVGEAVVNRAGTSRNKGAIDAMNKGAALGFGGGNSTTAEIKFEVTAIDAASFNSYLVSNKHVIENIISRSLSTNGAVRQSIKAVI